MNSDQQAQSSAASAQATPLVGEWEQIMHPLETRDEVGFVEFNGRMWIIGSSVTPAGATGREVFSSSDGLNWVSHGPGDFEGQRGPTAVVFDGYIYLVGGAMQTDIWRTNDPASGHWEKVADEAPWGIRHGASVVVFDDKMWLMGGMRFNNPEGTPDGWPIGGQPEYDAKSLNDIWMSEDGVNWIQVVEHAPWGARAHINGAAAVLDGKMYIASGGVITLQPFGTVREHVGEPYRDVWSSEDGINWTLETDHAPWAGRTFGSLTAYQGQLVLIGGSVGTDHRDMDHDLWFSSDGGKTWTQGDFPGLPRHASGILSFGDDLYITTGLQANDMWRLNGPKRLEDRAAVEDGAFSLMLSPASFDDFPANAVLEATLADGSPLPAWLTFDASDLSLTGTPLNEDVGMVSVVVRAVGPAGSGSTLFRIIVSNTNDNPLSSNVEINLNPGAGYVFGDPAVLFSDEDAGDAIAAIRIETLPDTGLLTLDGVAVVPGQVIMASDMGQLRFSPDGGAGAASTAFTFTTQDLAGAFADLASELRFNIGTLAPLAVDSNVLVNEGVAHSFGPADFGFADLNEGDGLSAIRIETLPVEGALELAGIPVTEGQTIAASEIGNLSFRPPTGGAFWQYGLELSVIDDGGSVSDERASLTIDINRLPEVQDVELHLRQDRLYMPAASDFGFTDADTGDQFAALRIDSVPDIGEFLLNGVPIVAGQIIPVWKIPQIAYIPLGTAHFVHEAEFHFSVQDSRGAFSESKAFSLIVDTILYRTKYLGSQDADTLTGDDGNNELVGLSGDDLLIGRPGDDILDGGAGNDTASFADFEQNIGASLTTRYGQATGVGTKWFWDIENLIGGSGDDILGGHDGDNRLDGGNGNDRLYGYGGKDLLLPGLGDDFVDGETGNDTVSFAGLTADITADLVSGISLGAGSKTILNVENLTGGSGNDGLAGDDGANRLEGGDGNDVLIGRLGDDILDGGAGDDTASFAGLTQNIGASLATRYGQATGAGTKWFWDIENLIGGSGDDILVGDAGSNLLDGGDGSDRLFGDAGDDILVSGLGDDFLHGGTGHDTVSFAGLTREIVASLNNGTSSGAGAKTIVHVENLIGGSGNDRLTGDDGANRLEGGDGDDTLIGRLGDDTLDGGMGNDTASFAGLTVAILASLTDGTSSGAGAKTISHVENLIGGSGNDQLAGDNGANRVEGGDGDDILIGHLGDDILDGGAGNDTASFAGVEQNVGIWLGTRYGQDSGAGIKWLWDIENLVGGNGNDILVGNDRSNRLEGSDGDDRLYGGAGDDVLVGGRGKDILHGEAGTDVFVYRTAVESTGVGFDQIRGFDIGEDTIDLGIQISGFAAATSGTLNLAQFDADLAAGMDAALGANQFGLFKATSGDMAGRIFGIADVDGDGAYLAGIDYVWEFVAPVLPVDQADIFM